MARYLSALCSSLYGMTTGPISVASKTWTPLVTTVRYRYHSEKCARPSRDFIKNYGYKDKIHNKGLLPHLDPDKQGTHLPKRIPRPSFSPRSNWSAKKKSFGENDYIDILGDGSLKPEEICYAVPYWLRGFKGDEYQMLLRKRQFLGKKMTVFYPTKMRDMNKRIRFLYRQLNNKTKDYYWHKA